MAYIEYVHIRPRSDVLLANLSQGIEFNADELRANRQGLIHRNQLRRIIRSEIGMPIISIVLTLLIGLGFRLAWLFTVEKRSFWKFFINTVYNPGHFLNQVNAAIEEPLPVMVQIIILIFPFLVVRQAVRLPWKLMLDLFGGKVWKEAGPVSARWDEKRLKGRKGKEGDLVSSYAYTIKEKHFKVLRAGYEALVSTIEYNVYYLPRTKRVLSTEPCDIATFEVRNGPNGIQVVRPAPTDLFI